MRKRICPQTAAVTQNNVAYTTADRGQARSYWQGDLRAKKAPLEGGVEVRACGLANR